MNPKKGPVSVMPSIPEAGTSQAKKRLLDSQAELDPTGGESHKKSRTHSLSKHEQEFGSGRRAQIYGFRVSAALPSG